MNPLIICLIATIVFLGHWFSDFVKQTDWQAINKSKAFRPLIEHTLTQTIYMTPFAFVALMLLGLPPWVGIPFAPVNLAVHTIIDYYTSRQVAKCFEADKRHAGFCVIGFDQLLHGLTYIWYAGIFYYYLGV